MKYETTIPFAGFYESTHNVLLDDALEQMFSDRGTGCQINDDLVNYAQDAIDWRKVFIDYAKDYLENFDLWLGLDLEITALESPREYNFVSDRIIATIPEASLLKAYTKVDKGVLIDVAKRRHTSYDGFYSFYNPDVSVWGSVTEWDLNQIGTLLQALAEDTVGGEFDGWQQYDLMEQSMGNGVLDEIICRNGGPKLERLLKIRDYLEDRKEREEVMA
jgi:hypothetical protein